MKCCGAECSTNFCPKCGKKNPACDALQDVLQHVRKIRDGHANNLRINEKIKAEGENSNPAWRDKKIATKKLLVERWSARVLALEQAVMDRDARESDSISGEK